MESRIAGELGIFHRGVPIEIVVNEVISHNGRVKPIDLLNIEILSARFGNLFGVKYERRQSTKGATYYVYRDPNNGEYISSQEAFDRCKDYFSARRYNKTLTIPDIKRIKFPKVD